MNVTVNAVKKACEKHGVNLTSGDWGVHPDRDDILVPDASMMVCPLGAVLLGQELLPNDYTFTSQAAWLLGKDTDWIVGFADGFDGAKLLKTKATYRHGYRAGTAFRRRAYKEGLLAPSPDPFEASDTVPKAAPSPA